ITASAVVEEPAKKSSITAFLFIRVTILDKYFIRLVGLGFVKISSISISFKRFIQNSLVKTPKSLFNLVFGVLYFLFVYFLYIHYFNYLYFILIIHPLII